MVTEPESRKGPGNRTPLTDRLTVTTREKCSSLEERHDVTDGPASSP